LADAQFSEAAVLEPISVDNIEDVAWSEVADVVVVGLGGAGAAAALEARENGASVIALDRFNGGGATAFSGGIVYSGGTRYQRDAGYADSPEEMFKYLSVEWGDFVSPDTLRRFCEGSAGDIDWLARHGVPFESTPFKEKASYPPNGYFLYFSGNEKFAGYKERAAPAPRGHRTVGKGYTGHIFYQKLREAVVREGVEIRTHARVTRLITDLSGAVAGVEINEIPADHRDEHNKLYGKISPLKPFNGEKSEQAIAAARELEQRVGQTRYIRARRGVILSAGGFCYNLPMLSRTMPFYASKYTSLLRIGSMGCDGTGIDLGRSAGGATGMMDHSYLGLSIAPPNAFLKGIAVNSEGQRFINEEVYSGFLGEAIGRQKDGVAWLVLDRSIYSRLVRQALFSGKMFMSFGLPALMNILMGGTKRAGSLEALAAKCGIDAGNLKQSVAAYNSAEKAGIPDPQGKSAENSQQLTKPPFYAINISLSNPLGFFFLFTLGGLVVDEDRGLVKREDGRTIPRLYAAGRSAVGLCSSNYISGTSLADCVFSGRRAGRDAARAGANEHPQSPSQREGETVQAWPGSAAMRGKTS
jgi:3-oxo-5alpha-steroid 4-dehydrogenase